ncbi:MAG: hypothetical protein HC843_03390 [Sphingomonadales bacterium]|nr:hypothetical protein [Sphingomonadales bacterium]
MDSQNQNPQKRAAILTDRARAQVAGSNMIAAESDLAEARRIDPDNGLVWLLSATLARRGGDLANAQSYIKTAAGLSPSDAAVALEAGNIAAAAKAYRIAREQWQQVIKIAPDSAQSETAKILLAELDLIEAGLLDSENKGAAETR